MKSASALLLAAVLAACTSVGDRTGSALPLWAKMEGPVGLEIRPSPGEPHSVVFGTLGSSGTDVEEDSKEEFNAVNRRVVVRRIGGGTGTDVRASFTRSRLDRLVGTPSELTYSLFPGGKPAEATAFLFRIKPGKYELRLSSSLTMPDSAGDPVVTFEAKAGMAVYLGELLSAADHSITREKSFPGCFLISDNLDRDFKLALRRAPDLQLQDVVNLSEQVKRSPHPLVRHVK